MGFLKRLRTLVEGNKEMEDMKIERWKKGIMETSQNPKKARGTVAINTTLHTFMVYTLGRRGLSQAVLAKICGCSPTFINQVITGRKKSDEIQRRMAEVLGFRSWDHLQWEALRFDAKINTPAFVLKDGVNGITG